MSEAAKAPPLRVIAGGLLLLLGAADVAVINLHLAPRLRERTAGVAEEPGAPSAPSLGPTLPRVTPPPSANERPPPVEERVVAEAPDVEVPSPASSVVRDPVPDLLFELGSAKLDAASVRALTEVARVLEADPSQKVVLRGHTCTQGDAERNAELSLQRAIAARNFLVRRGVPPNRIATEALGSRYPIQSDDGVVELARSRRVEVAW